MTDSTQLHDLLRTVAEEGGDPDVDVAWTAVTRSIAADRRHRARRRALTVGSALALGVAAAAVVVTTSPAESPQTLDVGPAGDPSGPDPSSPDPVTAPEPSSQVGTPIVLPSDPAVVLGPEGSALHVMDAATGAHVTTPITDLPPDERIIDATITTRGDVYLTLHIPEATVIAHTTWDGDGYVVLDFAAPPLGEGGGYSDVAVDDDGTTLAFAVSDVGPETYETAIGLFDLRSGVYRQLDWPEGDDRGSYHEPDGLSFSPLGTQLAFVNAHDTDGTDGFDAFLVDVDAATLAEAETVVAGQAWDITFDPSGDLVALVGASLADAAPVALTRGREVPPLDGATALMSSVGSVIARTDASWFRLDADGWVEVPFSDWTG